MIIIEFDRENQRAEWDGFVKTNGGSFLQSWEWGEVGKADGRKVRRLAAVGEDDGRIVCAASVIRHALPFGKSYLYIPRGPVFADGRIDQVVWRDFLYKFREIAGRENGIFLKVEPDLFVGRSESDLGLEKSGFRKNGSGIQPMRTSILDLGQSDEDLLGGMHPKTRYNIRLARKKGVIVRGWPGESAARYFEIFFELSEETAGRDRIRLFPKDHYRRVFEILGRSDLCELYTAEYGQEILAAIFVVFWGRTAIYLYGASASRYQNLMASPLVQWEAILDAKIKGLKFYDFWGIDDQKWPGITRFKKGFGGREIGYPGSWDCAFNPGWYGLYKAARKLRSF